jgi:hypothetical protein
MRYSIFVFEYGSDHEVELAKVGSNPQDIADALKKKMLTTKRRKGVKATKMPKYASVRIVDHQQADGVAKK